MNSYSLNNESGDGRQEASFQKLSQTIASNIQKIHQNVSSMQRMVNQYGSPQETPELKAQLHQTRNDTQQIIKDTDNLLKDMVNTKDRHLKIQRDRLVDEFTSAITAFQNIQKKTVVIEKSAYRAAQSNNYAIAKPPGSYNSSTNKSSIFEDNFVNGKEQSQIQAQQEEIDLQALEEQERTIRDLEENIVGVNEIYKKLGALVYEQGNVVDSIESSVEHTSVFVSEGTEQLRKASHYQNKVRKKKLIIGTILVAILLVLIGIIWWQS